MLAVAGAVGAPRGLRRIAAAYAVLAVAGVVLSLGPDGIRPLYAALYDWLFGMAAIRAPARFSVLVLCAIAVLAAFAIRALEGRRPRTGPLVALVVLAIGVEYGNRAAFSPPPALATEAGAFLRDQPGSGAVICVPLVMFDGNTPCMLQSLEHGRPVVNGYSGLRPPFFEALVDQMSRLPSPESLVALHDLGVEFIVSDSALAVDGGTETPLVERARFAGQLVYQMAWSPEIEAKLREASAPPPADPGPVPFAVGESATYTVRWTSGPVGIPAGEATIAVVPPPEAASFRFAVTAKTASWVSRFYEVDAALEATTDARLLPLAYREAIDEGGRRIDRRVAFDGSRREVRVDSGGTSITLPIDAGARDPISALFYIRTLPLAPGSRFSLPISDNGRRMRLDVLVHDIESIDVDGRARPAWRVEARLIDRLDRRTPAITAWVSADDRRLPVLIDVSAGFGSVRVELARAGR